MANRVHRVLILTGTLMGIASTSSTPVVWADSLTTEPMKSVLRQPFTDLLESSQDIVTNLPGVVPVTPVPFKDWKVQSEVVLVQIISVRLEQAEAGLKVVLEAADGKLVASTPTISGNTLVVKIPNAFLSLPEGDEFQAAAPVEGIANLEIKRLPDNQVQVIITGTGAPPQVQVNSENGNLLLSVVQGKAQAVEADDELEIVVTATRTEEDTQDVTRSLTVITREDIEDQTAITQNLGDILGRTVPGFAPGNQSFSEFGQSLRGRNSLVLIDGVPQSTNRNAFRNLRLVDPSAIERVEVLRGPSALYGDGATGGIINIITRPGGDGKPEFNAKVGFTGSLSRATADALGGTVQLGVAGKEGGLDYRLSGSFERIGSLFDAEGDRIPADQLSTQGSLTDTNSLQLFAKLGWESDDHRLQFTANHFNSSQNTNFITDPIVNTFPPGEQKALSRSGLQLDEQSEIRNTFLNLDYSHPDLIFGSRVHAQVYYRDYFTRFFPFDGGRFGRVTPEGFRIFQSRVESEEIGARLEVETPVIEQKLTLLTGLDFANEDSVQNIAIFDSAAFDASNGLVFNPITDRPWVPPLTQTNVGLFAQLKWQPIDALLIRGGVRYENIGVDVNTFTTLTGNTIPGGNLNYDAVLFNLGTTYSLTDQFDVFADFSQGFSVADVGLVLRGAQAGVTVESLNPEAQKVNSYELGVRGKWKNFQASLSGFFNESNLGTTFDRETLAVVRAPERIYGVEAAIDAQVSDTWKLGSTFSFVEGENDVDQDGNFLALTGFRIPPIKLTAYVENETLSGWRNRLQILYAGNRDRAFNDTVDFRSVDDYVTLDLISSLKLGRGTLQLGIQNLLNNQYFTAPSQLLRLRTNDSFTAAQGITFIVQYAVDF